jgi:hypothetical protein
MSESARYCRSTAAVTIAPLVEACGSTVMRMSAASPRLFSNPLAETDLHFPRVRIGGLCAGVHNPYDIVRVYTRAPEPDAAEAQVQGGHVVEDWDRLLQNVARACALVGVYPAGQDAGAQGHTPSSNSPSVSAH